MSETSKKIADAFKKAMQAKNAEPKEATKKDVNTAEQVAKDGEAGTIDRRSPAQSGGTANDESKGTEPEKTEKDAQNTADHLKSGRAGEEEKAGGEERQGALIGESGEKARGEFTAKAAPPDVSPKPHLQKKSEMEAEAAGASTAVTTNVNITIEGLTVREEADIDRIAEKLAARIEQAARIM